MSVNSPITCGGTQLLDVPGGHGGPQHAPPLEAGGESPAEDHRGGGGQLPWDAGPPADTEGASSVPSTLDPGENETMPPVNLMERLGDSQSAIGDKQQMIKQEKKPQIFPLLIGFKNSWCSFLSQLCLLPLLAFTNTLKETGKGEGHTSTCSASRSDLMGKDAAEN